MLVKVQVSAVQLDVKFATGGWLAAVTVTPCEWAFVAPRLSVTVRVTVYVPPAPYVCDGFWVVTTGEPSPKFQL